VKTKTLLKFLGGYVSIIIVFSIIFSYHSKDFYHSTVKYEHETSDIHEDIKVSVENSIKNNYKKYYGDKEIFLDDNKRWQFNINQLSIYNLDYKENKLSFDVMIYITDLNSRRANIENKNEHIYDLNLKLFKLVEDGSSEGYEEGKETIFVTKFNVALKNETTGRINYKKIFRVKNFPNNNAEIEIPEKLTKKIEIYRNSINGFPEDLNGNYFRMLYLSMVTITTLGYGDIVPLTNLTRFLVALEAVLGIIILGLFVNSIFTGAENRKEEEKSKNIISK